MRRILPPAIAAAAAAALAACSSHPVAENQVDIDAAATRAETDINSYAANVAVQPAPTPAAIGTPAATPTAASTTSTTTTTTYSVQPPAPGQPGGLPDDRTPVAEGPFAPDSAQGAADVVQRYYALLESGRYGQAYALWEQGGRASGMSADAFAASFSKYSEYHAQVGAPGRIDAGAGQRHVQVPVVVYGRTRTGSAVHLAGPVTLHLTVVDGAPAAARRWHIAASALKSAPGPVAATSDAAQATAAPATPAIVDARYGCEDGSRFRVRFDNRADVATVRLPGGPALTLGGQKPASGIWYLGQGYELRGKGRDADFHRPGRPTVHCTAAS